MISWCRDALYPVTLFGTSTWSAVSFNLTVKVPSGVEPPPSVFVAAMIATGGCHGTAQAQGLFFWLNITENWTITGDIGK